MTFKHRIYLASSGRNPKHEEALSLLRSAGCDVYDWKHPKPGLAGFSLSEVDPNWESWTPEEFLKSWSHFALQRQFDCGKEALRACEACVLLLPCGASAYLEAGYCIGRGKPVLIVLSEHNFRPELMYRLASYVVADLKDMTRALEFLLK